MEENHAFPDYNVKALCPKAFLRGFFLIGLERKVTRADPAKIKQWGRRGDE